jgi:hypothetical protein
MATRDDLMAEISEILSIPQVHKGVGSSVHNDFIGPLTRAVLGDELAESFPEKYRKIENVIRALGGVYLKADPTERGAGHTSEGTTSGGGGTLTNTGLETIRDLLITNGVKSITWASDPGVAELLDEGFTPEGIVDTRLRRQAEVAVRRGGVKFRAAVRRAYQDTCCITGANDLAALEAAHIAPYQGDQSDVVGNSLLLRADLHKLHDALLLAVSDEDLTVLMKPRLLASSYAQYAGKAITPPGGFTLSLEALRFQRERAGL